VRYSVYMQRLWGNVKGIVLKSGAEFKCSNRANWVYKKLVHEELYPGSTYSLTYMYADFVCSRIIYVYTESDRILMLCNFEYSLTDRLRYKSTRIEPRYNITSLIFYVDFLSYSVQIPR
jgi:hypothetical protein